ncbi:unnamed protein product [Prunus brigantina]
MLEVSSRWVREVGDGPLVPLTYYDENDIHKKLDLSPDTTNVHKALNILARFCGLGWLLILDHPSSVCHEQVFRKGVSSAENVPMGVASSSSARIKRLTIANNKKINGMQKLRDILLRFPLELPKTHDLPYKEAIEKQGLGCLCRSWDQTEKTVHLSSNHNSSEKPRTIKRGANSMLQVTAKRAKESSARAKSP